MPGLGTLGVEVYVREAPRDPTGYHAKFGLGSGRSSFREPHSDTGCHLRSSALVDRKPLALGKVSADTPRQAGHQQHDP